MAYVRSKKKFFFICMTIESKANLFKCLLKALKLKQKNFTIGVAVVLQVNDWPTSQKNLSSTPSLQYEENISFDNFSSNITLKNILICRLICPVKSISQLYEITSGVVWDLLKKVK